VGAERWKPLDIFTVPCGFQQCFLWLRSSLKSRRKVLRIAVHIAVEVTVTAFQLGDDERCKKGETKWGGSEGNHVSMGERARGRRFYTKNTEKKSAMTLKFLQHRHG
jgi:hypothetical protein